MVDQRAYCFLLLQKFLVWFLASTSANSKPPVTPAPSDLMPSSDGHGHSLMHIPTAPTHSTHSHRHILRKKLQEKEIVGQGGRIFQPVPGKYFKAKTVDLS